MAAFDVEEFLKDARLVVDYAARAGRLPDESLPKAAAAAEQAVKAGGEPDILPLVKSLNASVRAIAPMTLVELRAGRSPFDPRTRRSVRSFQAFLCVFSAILMSAAAYYTELLHRADTAVKALQQVQQARPLEKLNAVRRMAQRDRVLEKRDSQYDQYLRAVNDLQDLQDQMSGAFQLANAVASRAAWPFDRELGESYSFAEGSEPQERRDNCKTSAKLEETTAKPTSNIQNTGKRTEAGVIAASAGATEGDGDLDFLTNMPLWLCGVVSDMKAHFAFSATLGIASNHLPTSYLMYEMQARIAALNGWFLPLVYGLLGAAVFLMRSMLDTRTPSIDAFPALLRIALGGIAGIVIGWFWVPSPTKGGDLINITSAPFAFAFVAGFSIDILLSLLDRVNRTIADEGGRESARDSRESAEGRASSGSKTEH